ncbi:MAG: hypothetical protein WB715_27935 [Roseiarcus sp.]|uniref:hypothetical protein n=1 Tax=Roseiarcus sp. TaxID=1969460 RepID=UPI003C502DB7
MKTKGFIFVPELPGRDETAGFEWLCAAGEGKLPVPGLSEQGELLPTIGSIFDVNREVLRQNRHGTARFSRTIKIEQAGVQPTELDARPHRLARHRQPGPAPAHSHPQATHGASDLNGTARSVMVLLGGGDGTESQRRTLSDAEIRDCDWVGGIAASGSLCDRPSRVHHAAVEKRDHQGSQQRYHGSQMATMLD